MMLASVFENATKDKQHGAAATAAMGMAKLHGLLVDKTEDVTRRAARSPDAPIEIDVEHWLTEQTSLPSPAGNGAQSPSNGGGPTGTGGNHQSPDQSPMPMGHEGQEPPKDESPSEGQSPQGSEPYEGSDDGMQVQRKDEQLQ